MTTPSAAPGSHRTSLGGTAHWGTQYEKGPPSFPPMGLVATWFWIGLVPQLTLWIAITAVVGSLFGGLAALVALRGRRAATA